jgi:hypothetical protein
MLKNPSNPLLKTASAAAPVKTSGQPAANSPAETENGNDSAKESEEEEEEEEEDPETPNPAAPEPEPAADPNASSAAPAAKPRLTAFERGALRALGKGDLIARVERAESQAVELTEQVATLQAENTRLAGELSALKKETPAKIEAAEKGRANEVSKGVIAELSGLGITKEAAPAALNADGKQTATNRQEALQQYAQLQGKEKREFYLKNRDLLV